jgi:lipopolysaccharide assembly protein A
MLALVAVLVFVFQNLQRTKVSFLMLSGRAPLGLALVAAALLGGLVVFGLGSVRIMQLRTLARRRYRSLQQRP